MAGPEPPLNNSHGPESAKIPTSGIIPTTQEQIAQRLYEALSEPLIDPDAFFAAPPRENRPTSREAL